MSFSLVWSNWDGFINSRGQVQADQINTLEREQDYVEEQFDYIQQTLRTVALQCRSHVFPGMELSTLTNLDRLAI